MWGPSVTIRNTYTHRTAVGHNIKTRGLINYILYNKIADEEDGTGSYAIDVPDCGRTYIIGNVIEQGLLSENYDVVSYGAESDKNDLKELYVINNTFVNDGRSDGAFIHCRRKAHVRIQNNIFYGPGTPWEGGDVSATSNYIAGSLRNTPRFADPGGYDFHLTPDSPDAILGRGTPPGVSSTGFDLTPKQEYVEGAKSKARAAARALDLGAFAFQSHPAPALDADLPRPAAQGTRVAAPTTTKVSKAPKHKKAVRKSKRPAPGASAPRKTTTSSN